MEMGTYADLVTPRLELIAIAPAALLSERAGDGRLPELIGCLVPANWPPEHWEPHVFDILLAQYERRPEQVAWHRYVALREADGRRTLIGATGSFWRESAPEECEIGYGLLPEYEGRGLATEAARALIEVIREDDEIRSVVAHTFPKLVGSVRVMEKCGFLFEGPGEEEGTLRYRLQLRE